jgi:uncharacterized protein DUF559
VARTARVVPELKGRTFSLDEARALGITPSALRGMSYERVGSRLYRFKERIPDRWDVIEALARQLPGSAVFVKRTAAWLHGLDLAPTEPAQVAVPPPLRLASRAGLEVHQANVGDEIVRFGAISATTLPRTLLDLCATLTPVEALVAIDMASHAKLIDKDALCLYSDDAKGRRGVARLRQLAALAAPAESPMETRLRWLLVSAGLPPPEVQTELYDESGSFLGRADLYYPQAQLVIEFDGGNHRDRLVGDNRRQNCLHGAGYQMLRFTAPDVYGRPRNVVALVTAALKRQLR